MSVQSVILNTGKPLLTQALAGLELFAPTRFEVGSTADYQPLETDTGPAGTVVFTGNQLLIQRKQIAPDTARYILTIPEGEGPFPIGNILLYGASLADDDEVPFVAVTLPFQYQKIVSNPNLSGDTITPVPGNRFVCNINIKHSLNATTIAVTIETPLFSSLAFYDTVAGVPPPLTNPWKTFVAHDDPRSNTPALIVERNDGSYWGIPTWQSFRDPKFGVIDGGVSGDNYKPYPANYAWGYQYLTPLASFSGSIGGSDYAAVEDDFSGIIGGISY